MALRKRKDPYETFHDPNDGFGHRYDPSIARSAADGPDSWAVTGVVPGDVLNIREQADASAAKVGEATHNATGLLNLGCNEESFDGWQGGDIAIREEIMNKRWCKVSYNGTVGWVRGKFLRGE